jgi:hypothetical protein
MAVNAGHVGKTTSDGTRRNSLVSDGARPNVPGMSPRPGLVFVVWIAALLAAGCRSADAPASGGFRAPRFPIRIADDRTHLADADGLPFLYHADTPWGLVTRLRREEVERYLDHRRAAGFNAVQVQLIPEAAITPGTNAYGHAPFRKPGDLSTPDGRYFDHAAWVVEQARKRGILVAFNPVWLGCCDGGRRDLMASNGVERCRQLGRFLGRRFRRFDNVLWIQGGDRDPGKWRPFVDAVAEGIDEMAPNALQTAHWSSTHSSLDEIGDARWLDLNATYTYAAEHVGAWRRQYHVYHSARRDAERVPRMPFFLIESTYEGEHGATPQKIRRQAWWAVLSGACGQAMGNGHIWGFRGGWEAQLDTAAVRDMGVLRRVLETHRWWTLHPDFGHRVLTNGFGTYNGGDRPGGDDYVTAAAASDGTLLAYVPEGGTVSVASFPEVREVDWIDPTDGRSVARLGISADTGFATSTPGRNAEGGRDWVLAVRPARR